MKFLGDLGIDTKLLLAQIINFGVLLWLLSRFLYRPIIRRIEKDEEELKQVQTQKKKLEQERGDFSEQKKKETKGAKERATKIITEAEDIAGKLKKEMREKAEQETSEIIKQSRNEGESLKFTIKKELAKDLRAETVSLFKKSFGDALSVPRQKEFQNVFWADLVKQAESLVLKKAKDPDLAEILEKLNLAGGRRGKQGKEAPEKELENILAQKIGPIRLEYACPMLAGQTEELEKIISEKIGFKLKIDARQNKNLVNGFRFEIMGMIIESNLLNIIKNAASYEE